MFFDPDMVFIHETFRLIKKNLFILFESLTIDFSKDSIYIWKL